MKTIFETCTPREDVLKGALTEDVFAADLQAVASGSAPEVYGDPTFFFNNSYPTEGLKTLVGEVFGRFSKARASSAVLRLETSFGGGKTHNLIALWHIGKSPNIAKTVAPWIEPDVLPQRPIHVVALSCEKYGADEVAIHGNVVIRTLWGEMAWQLDNYSRLQSSDEERLAPSESTLDALFSGKQVLVLLDELAAYLRSAKGKRVGGGTLADQTLRFFHLLLGYAASHDNVVLVYTLAESKDAYSKESDEIVEQIRESKSLSARQERVLTPTSEGEVAQILKRRLFHSVDTAAGKSVVAAYSEYLSKAFQQGAALPPEVIELGYRKRFEEAYPFHPEFLTTLYRKTASFGNFQRTRGALRLLAAVVRSLWQRKPADAYLIQSADIDLSNDTIRNDLTSRLDRAKLDSAISADIWSEHGDAHAQEFDQEWSSKGHPGLCQRVAQAIFLHSLVNTHEGALGAELSDVFLACLRPGLSFDLVEKVLEQIDTKFWYADFDGKHYFFRDEATLKKLVEDAASSISNIAAKEALRQKIREVYGNGGIFSGPAFFPSGPQDVDDEAGKPKLVVMDFDHVAFSAGSQEVPPIVEEIFKRKGETLGFRTFQNNLVVLVADAVERAGLVEKARYFKGIETLSRAETTKQQLSKEGQRKLQERKDVAELEYLVAVTNAYRHLFFPSTFGGGIDHYQLPPQDSSGAKRQQQAVLRDKLVELKEALTDASEPLAPEYVFDKAWPDKAEDVTTQELERIIRKRPRLYLLFDVEPLRATIKKGVETGVWVYHDGKTVYRKGNPPLASAIRFDATCTLMTPGRADVLFPVAPPVPQPNQLPPAIPPEGGGSDQPVPVAVPPAPPAPSGQRLQATGAVSKAFAELRDQISDAAVKELDAITVDVAGAQNVRALIAMWPALLTYQAEVWVTLKLVGRASGDQVMEIHFNGPGKYFQRMKQAIEGFTADFSSASDFFATVQVQLRFQPPLAIVDAHLDQMEQDLASYGFGEIALEAKFEKEGV